MAPIRVLSVKVILRALIYEVVRSALVVAFHLMLTRLTSVSRGAGGLGNVKATRSGVAALARIEIAVDGVGMYCSIPLSVSSNRMHSPRQKEIPE